LSPRRIVALKSRTSGAPAPGQAKSTCSSSATTRPLRTPASSCSRAWPSASRHARDAARAPRLHPLPHPGLLLPEQLVRARVGLGLRRELRVALPFEGGEVAGAAVQPAAVQLDDARGHRVEEGAVVADQHHRAGVVAQQRLEPGDRVQVEVVRRLVEQQQPGPRDQRLRERDALARAAGQIADALRPVELQLRQHAPDLLLPVPAVQRLDPRLQRVQVLARRVRLVARAQRAGVGHAVGDHVEHRVRLVEAALLRDIAAAQALRPAQLARVRRLEPREQPQQRRLARAVAADQADALAGIDDQVGAGEQRHVAVGQVRSGQGQQRHRDRSGGGPRIIGTAGRRGCRSAGRERFAGIRPGPAAAPCRARATVRYAANVPVRAGTRGL
jgi:hypothetical protein